MVFEVSDENLSVINFVRMNIEESKSCNKVQIDENLFWQIYFKVT